MLDQDDSLDRLSESIGRQRELSIQIGDELDSQGELLEDLDVVVDRSRSRLDGARRRLDRFSRKAKDNGTPLFLSSPLDGGFWLPWLRGVCCVLAVAADADFRVDGGDWGFDTCARYIDYYFQVAC